MGFTHSESLDVDRIQLLILTARGELIASQHIVAIWVRMTLSAK